MKKMSKKSLADRDSLPAGGEKHRIGRHASTGARAGASSATSADGD